MTVNYRIEGQGNPVVLLHGFLENLHIWDDFSKVLSQNCQVIRIDLPGHGETQVSKEIFSMEFMADAVHQVLLRENISEVCIVGHSMGGYVALAYAEKYPENVKGLGLFHSSAACDDAQALQNRLRSIQLIEKDHTHFMHTFIPDLFTEKNRNLLKSEIAQLQKQTALISKENLIACQKGMLERKDYQNIIQNSTIHIMYIIGKQDPRIKPEKILQQAAQGKTVEILLLEDCGHVGFLEAPQESLRFLESFVQHCF